MLFKWGCHGQEWLKGTSHKAMVTIWGWCCYGIG
jgi:hypothetical protein